MTEFEEKLEQLLLAQIDGCTGLDAVERLSGGASQETYRIVIRSSSGARTLCMRRAAGGGYDEARLPGLGGEALLMQIARKSGVPAPEVYYVLQRTDDLGGGFIMEWLEGEALGSRILRDEKYAKLRPGLAYECGRIMARIHNIDLDSTRLRARLQVLTPENYVHQTWEHYQTLNVPQPMIDYVGQWLLRNLPKIDRVTLVHNEFRNGNFMVSSEKVLGVLDWEVAHIGDPVRDLGWLCTNAWRYGESLPVGGFGSYEDLLRGYEEESGIRVDPLHVQFWEVFGSFWWSVTCLRFTERFRAGPDRSIERAMVGRRAAEGQIDCVNILMPGPVTEAPRGSIENLDSPRTDELLTEVSNFLREEVMGSAQGRTRFLARVAANAVDLAKREAESLSESRGWELASLQSLFGTTEDGLEVLRWRLVKKLQDDDVDLDENQLRAHLRQAVTNQIAIDHPSYSGYQQAISR
jgi:aminoglycoside phosphotransferase (APT) family kinase protein